MASGERIGAVLFGGILLGVWLYGLLFAFPEWQEFSVASWFAWGLLGLVLAGAIYGARATKDTARLLLIALIGIIISIVTIGATLNSTENAFAATFTLAGGVLIAAALPKPQLETPPPSNTSTNQR